MATDRNFCKSWYFRLATRTKNHLIGLAWRTTSHFDHWNHWSGILCASLFLKVLMLNCYHTSCLHNLTKHCLEISALHLSSFCDGRTWCSRNPCQQHSLSISSGLVDLNSHHVSNLLFYFFHHSCFTLYSQSLILMASVDLEYFVIWIELLNFESFAWRQLAYASSTKKWVEVLIIDYPSMLNCRPASSQSSSVCIWYQLQV